MKKLSEKTELRYCKSDLAATRKELAALKINVVALTARLNDAVQNAREWKNRFDQLLSRDMKK